MFWQISTWFKLTDATAAPVLYMIGMITYTNSVLLLVLVSMDRYLMLCHQRKAIKICTTKLMKMYIGCIYIFSFISNIPRVFEHRLESSQDGTSTQVMKTDLGCSYAFQMIYIIGITMVIRLIIPIILLAFSNIQLLRKVSIFFKKSMSIIDGGFHFLESFCLIINIFLQVMEINKEIKNAFGSNFQGSNNKEKKITIMIMVVVFLFFICNITEATVFMLGDKIAHTPSIFHFVLCINSSVNSLVYGIFNSQYRKIFLELLCCKRKKNNLQSTIKTRITLNTIS